MRIERDTAHAVGLFLAIVAVFVPLFVWIDAKRAARMDRIDAVLDAAHEDLERAGERSARPERTAAGALGRPIPDRAADASAD